MARFSETDARKDILRKLLSFRAKLFELKVEGFQWIGGSFVENIEAQENRAPKDVDVVTFVKRPHDPQKFEELARTNNIWFKREVEESYGLDNFWVHYDLQPFKLIQVATFWHGLFTHRRDQLWKGIVTIDILDQADDKQAISALRVDLE